MKKKFKITEKGKKDLEQELDELKSRRGVIAEKIADARDYGDLSENAEYDAARDEQNVMESRIEEIEDILNNAEIISSQKSDRVCLGSLVELESNGSHFSYTIVSPIEANPLDGKISNESPLGVALMDKIVGDEAAITTPKGQMIYKVINIK